MPDGQPPLVSVVMSVYNGEQFLRDACDSILAQSLSHFELIVVDDGSTDGTADLLGGIADPRVRTIARRHAGLAAALNAGVAEARADLIARMDADDVAAPDRLRLQHQFLLDHPRVALVGTAARIVDYAGTELDLWRPPCDHATIRRRMIGANQFGHGSVMFRRTAFDAAGGYREDMPRAQDYDLWLRLLPRVETANLDQVLMTRRVGPDQFGTSAETEQIRWALRARIRALRRGDFPAHYALGLLRPMTAAITPGPLRQFVRRCLPGSAEAARRIGRSGA